MQAFEGSVAVVTGAASGIGLEMARQLHSAGATVIASDYDADRLRDETSAMKEDGGAPFSAEVLDVTDTPALQAFIDGAARAHGHIDYMFNIAGIGGVSGEVRDLAPADWDPIVQVNLMAMVHGSSFAYRHMRDAGRGHIVNMASAAGLLGAPSGIPYSTTKAAMVAFSRDLRTEAATFGVKVTVLCPGFIDSRIFENTEQGAIDPQKSKALIPFKFVPTDKAVRTMLRGVLADKPIVTLPGYVNHFWRLRRVFPRTFDRLMGGRVMNEARKARVSD